MLFLTGFGMADPGMFPVPETQEIMTSTSLNAVGNFASVTELQWRITDDPTGLPGVPPLFPGGIGSPSGVSIYESTYTEDTQTRGVGLMLYDKEMDVETSGQISGQWNIEATKQIAYLGVDGASVVSRDTIMVDGAGIETFRDEFLCPFVQDISQVIPMFCNRAEAGSSIDMTVANVRTTTTDRFVTPSIDHPVELNHDIRVAELVTDMPSIGMASASLDVLIQEGGYSLNEGDFRSELLCERIEFTEETSADGAITLFEKLMHYESGMVR